MRADDVRRCDNVTGVVYEPENADLFAEQVAPAVVPEVAPAVAPAPEVVATVSFLTRRPTQDMCNNYNHEPAPARAVIANTNDAVLDYSRRQETWERLVPNTGFHNVSYTGFGIIKYTRFKNV